MKKERFIYITIILLLLTLLFYILLQDYEMTVQGITYKQKILYYLLGME